MNKIKKLAPHEAQKIAAGEVVERPANILKELLENAIDAQSSKIIIYVEDGGKELIRVIDNGCGMSSDDARLCFEQHATSKIVSVDQLQAINTFGFRGEALASIAAVSKITLITKEATAEYGTKIEIEANSILTHEIAPAQDGTDISISKLFFNLPARKKFLKTRETEFHQIQQLFFAFCLAHPQIEFRLYSQGNSLYACPKAHSFKERVEQLFGQHITKHTIAVDYQHKDIQISGFISDHQYERYDRTMIYIFVNQRWVKDAVLSHALIKGYKQVLPPGRYPTASLAITVAQHEVDINIHPRKEEVQFLHPRNVQQAITDAVTQALEQQVSAHLKKSVTFTAATQAEPFRTWSPSFSPFNFDTFLKSSRLENEQVADFAAHSTKSVDIIAQPSNTPVESNQSEFISSVDKDKVYTIIGQYNKTYLLLEQENGLLMIDQHAAHERIIYEQLIAQHGNLPTIQLLFAQTINLSAEDVLLINRHVDLFAQYGIKIEPFGNETVKIEATPIQLKNVDLIGFIKDILGYIHECALLDQTTFDQTMQKKLYAQMACKTATKAGDSLTQQEMHELIKQLFATPHRFSCPHGRPTIWLLHLDEIKKKFKRDYRSAQQLLHNQ